MKRSLSALILPIVALIVSSCTSAPDALDDVRNEFPDPGLSPEEVVRIQLRAFANNNESDEGVEIGFRFASPSNRAATGPVDRFAQMLRIGYPMMLQHDRAEFAPLVMRDGVAIQRVALYRAGDVSVFDFILSRQNRGEYVDCWMTDGVFLRARGADTEAPVI